MAPTQRQGRTLGTATAVLRTYTLLRSKPDGVRVEDVAALVGKSTWTARYLLNSLCQEGFARREPGSGRYVSADPDDRAAGPSAATAAVRVSHRTEGRHGPPSAGAIDPSRLRDGLREVSLRTGQRAYLALVDGPRVVVADVVGKRGQPTLEGVHPGMSAQAHALAIGKAILAYQDPAAVLEYAARTGLPAFTPRTIGDPRAFLSELEGIRARGHALDLEEFREGFCCIAAPVFAADGTVVGAIGVSVPVRRFQRERAEITEVVAQVAWQVSSPRSDGWVGRPRNGWCQPGGPASARLAPDDREREPGRREGGEG